MTRIDPVNTALWLFLIALVVLFWAGVGYFFWSAFGMWGRL